MALAVFARSIRTLFQSDRHSRAAAFAVTVLVAALASLTPSSSPADIDNPLRAGCDATVTWDVAEDDTVATVNVLMVNGSGDTLYTLGDGVENSGSYSFGVPCIEMDTMVVNVQVFAVVDTPYAFTDDMTSIVSQAPTAGVTAEGGAVDENCSRTVTFSGEAFDDCGLDSADVAIDVSLLDGDATMSEVDLTVTPTDTSIVYSGSVMVGLNDGLPASIVVSVTATDNCERVAMAADTADVFDETPPVITCPGDIVVECSSTGGTSAEDTLIAAFLSGASATDNCSEPTLDNDAPEFFELGTTVVVFTATDAAGNAAACSASVEVVDTTPPDITLELNRYWLWPPNHKFHDIVATVAVTDVCDPEPTFILESIESNEAPNGRGDGNTNPDIRDADTGSADTEFALRAERSGRGDGRLYTITYTASDMSGNDSTTTATVFVPHDMSGKGMASNGFTNLGNGIDDASQRIVIVVPSDDEVDATAIDMRKSQIGNMKGVANPDEFYTGDVTGDGMADLAIVFPASTARDLMLKAKGQKDKTSLHYIDAEGNHRVVYDIFDTGDRVDVDLASLERVTFADEDSGEGEDGGDDPSDDPSGEGGDDTGDEPAKPEEKTPTEVLSAHPNPFNPTTTVTYVVQAAGPVTVSVYDIKGRLVRELVNRSTAAAGDYRVTWDGLNASGESVASGIYFVRLESTGAQVTKKVVMLK